MANLDFINRRFQQILPSPIKYIEPVPLRELKVWLKDDVGSVVGDYARRPAFREKATWAIRCLARGAKSAERQIIDEAENSLFNTAKSFLALLKNERVRSQVCRSFPARRHVLSETVEIGAHGAKALTRTTGFVDGFAIAESQLRFHCSQGPSSFNLINTDDYFGPQQSFVRDSDRKNVQLATHIVSLTPELHPVGNFITQSAVVRLKEFVDLLTSLRRMTACAIAALKRSYKGQDLADQAWETLQANLKEFRNHLQSGTENDLRNDCMILTQIYAAFHPSPDLSWLELDEQLIEQTCHELRQRIHGYRSGEMFERINAAVVALKNLYDDQCPAVSAREEAITRGDLVLVVADRLLYWEGRMTAFRNRSEVTAWEDFLCLAKKSRTSQDVTTTDLFGDKIVGRSSFPMRINRLKSRLPKTLCKHIVPGTKACTIRLQIERSRIHIH